jgi:glycosyltransferase involved in cell wall biosynthesis
MNIALLHYTCPPVIGGVETVLGQQARLLAANGHRVVVLCGKGRPFTNGVPVQIVPELSSNDGSLFAPPTGTAAGQTAEETIMSRVHPVEAILNKHLEGVNIAVAHNLLTMPFNLAATHALIRLAASGMPLVAWTHDLAAVNPDYHVPRNPAFDVLRSFQSPVHYVAVSETRAREFLAMTGVPVEAVIPNGLDLASTLGITNEVYALLGPLKTEAALLFYPTRILRRKNIELAIEVLAACRDFGYPAKLIVSGAADPHGPGDQAYLNDLKRRANVLGIAPDVVWVNEHFFVDTNHLRSLYLMADGVIYLSRQEGFGLPPLEAAAFRLPIFCSAIEPLRTHLPFNSVTFDLHNSPRKIAEKIIHALENDPAYLSRKCLIRGHSAQRFYLEQMEPLLRRLA